MSVVQGHPPVLDRRRLHHEVGQGVHFKHFVVQLHQLAVLLGRDLEHFDLLLVARPQPFHFLPEDRIQDRMFHEGLTVDKRALDQHDLPLLESSQRKQAIL